MAANSDFGLLLYNFINEVLFQLQYYNTDLNGLGKILGQNIKVEFNNYSVNGLCF